MGCIVIMTSFGAFVLNVAELYARTKPQHRSPGFKPRFVEYQNAEVPSNHDLFRTGFEDSSAGFGSSDFASSKKEYRVSSSVADHTSTSLSKASGRTTADWLSDTKVATWKKEWRTMVTKGPNRLE